MRWISSFFVLVALIVAIPMDNTSHASAGAKHRAEWLTRADASFCDRYLHLCGAPSELWDILEKKARGAQSLAKTGIAQVQATETWQSAVASMKNVGKVQHAQAALSAEDVEYNFAGANRWRNLR
jgi:hypothetical protein